jgi:type II secretory ATPase GspE/PulE/Tfp pilus assembly ATPase PilB-like protein
MKNTVKSMADLPVKWRLHDDFYDLREQTSDLHITEQLKQHLVALVEEGSLASQNKIILVVMKNSRSNNSVSMFLRNAQKLANGQPVDIRLCDDQNLIPSIYIEAKKKSGSALIKLNDEDTREVKKVENILSDAMDMKTSDIHIETHNGSSIVRFRVFTELLTYDHLTTTEAVSFANICYATFTSQGEETGTGAGSYQPTSLLEGEFSRKCGDHNIRARMVNLSCNDGKSFDFILRLIDKNKSSAPVPPRELGFSERVSSLLDEIAKASQGAILIVGVTGSGKSTSQQNLIKLEKRDSGGRKKIITLEDPVEYPIDGITQVTVSESKDKDKSSAEDFSFENLNAKLLRSDPDSIAYGEIRDASSAKAAYKGVESGHRVYGTMHTSSAMGAFNRLVSFGLERDTVCKEGFIAGILFQHLIPKLCPHCSKPHKKEDIVPEKFNEMFVINDFITKQALSNTKVNLKVATEALTRAEGKPLIRQLQAEGFINSIEAALMIKELRGINLHSERVLLTERINGIILTSGLASDDFNIRFRGLGCDHCFNGHVGVVPCAEVIVPDKTFLDLVKDNKLSEAEMYWKASLRGRTAIEDSYSKIFDGNIDPRSAETHLGYIGR